MVDAFITLEQDRPVEGWDDPQHGRVTWRTLVSGDITPSNELSGGIAYLAPGDILKPHRHAPAEVYFIVEGTPIVTLNGVDQVATPGSAVFIPGNVEHGIRNEGPGAARFFYCFAVNSFSDVEYRFPPLS